MRQVPSAPCSRAPGASAELPAGDATRVAVDSGALVRADAASGLAHLIDATGTAFAVPGADADVLGRLGYATSDVAQVSAAWLQVPTGRGRALNRRGGRVEPGRRPPTPVLAECPAGGRRAEP